jgi:hypothetical protein
VTGDRVRLFIQFAISATLGCWGYLASAEEPNPMARYVIALTAGFGGLWLLMFLWTWLRHGWSAARSMRMDMR